MSATATITAAPERRAAGRADEPIVVQAVVAPEAVAAWRAYAGRAAEATVCHDPAWCAAVERVFGHRGHHRVALRGGRPVGVLPLMEVRSLLGGTMLISVPYGTYGGILADDDAARDALAAEAERLTRERGARVLEARSARGAVPYWENVERYDGFARDLPETVGELRDFLPQHARAAVRRAQEREGLTVRHEGGALRCAWELYARTMRRLGSLSYPYEFFAELAARLPERLWVTLALRHGRAVAGVVSLVHGETVMPYFVGADERVRAYGAHSLIYFAVMERAVRAGLRRFDFGRTRKNNPGPAAFKRNQGFAPRTLGYQRYVPPGRTAPDLTPSNRRFALARRVWRHLPLVVTRAAGAQLAKWLPG